MRLMAGTAKVQEVVLAMRDLFPGRSEQFEKVGQLAKLGLQIDITPVRRRHTNEQQKAYWACLHEYGKERGYSAAETESLLHPVICAEAFGMRERRAIRCRGQEYQWPVPNETSSKDAEGKVRDAETYSMLIDTLLRFAAEDGVVLEIKR